MLCPCSPAAIALGAVGAREGRASFWSFWALRPAMSSHANLFETYEEEWRGLTVRSKRWEGGATGATNSTATLAGRSLRWHRQDTGAQRAGARAPTQDRCVVPWRRAPCPSPALAPVTEKLQEAEDAVDGMGIACRYKSRANDATLNTAHQRGAPNITALSARLKDYRTELDNLKKNFSKAQYAVSSFCCCGIALTIVAAARRC